MTIPTRICETCNGQKIITVLPLSAQAIHALGRAVPTEEVCAVRQTCPTCHGDGYVWCRRG